MNTDTLSITANIFLALAVAAACILTTLVIRKKCRVGLKSLGFPLIATLVGSIVCFMALLTLIENHKGLEQGVEQGESHIPRES